MYCLKFWGGVFIIWWITLTSIFNYSKWGLKREREQKKKKCWRLLVVKLRKPKIPPVETMVESMNYFFLVWVSWYILLIGANCNSIKIILTLRHCPFSRISFTDFYVIIKKKCFGTNPWNGWTKSIDRNRQKLSKKIVWGITSGKKYCIDICKFVKEQALWYVYKCTVVYRCIQTDNANETVCVCVDVEINVG